MTTNSNCSKAISRSPTKGPTPTFPSKELGFTIVEVMIVVAIISILAVIALPVYQDYVLRGKVSEGLIFAAEAKTTVSERFYTTREMPTSNATAGLGAASDYDAHKFIKALEITSIPKAGTIVVTFKFPGSSSADGKQIQLVPSTQTGDIHWTCSPTAIPNGMKNSRVPPNCRN